MAVPNAAACPPPDVLGAFVEGRMNGMERRAVQQHIASCVECAFVVGGTVRFLTNEDAADTEDETPKQSLSVGAFAAVVAVSVVLLVVVWRLAIVRDPMVRLRRVLARTSTRSLEGHVATFPHARFRAPRSAVPPADATLRIEAERIARLAGNDAATLHARGLAALLLGRDREAIILLASACRIASRNASYWSDLSAALMPNRPQAAVDAADRAIAIDPSLAAAHFNRGLALERLGQVALAAQAYSRSSVLEHDPGWAAEARQRQESVPR